MARRQRVCTEDRGLQMLARIASDSRGMAFLMSLFVLVALGMMLFGFQFMIQSEASFAGLNRNSSIALALAEGGAQEAMKRLATFGKGPGTSIFTNSLVNSGLYPGATGTVTYEPPLANDPQIFPILSTATYGGTTRAVRVYVQSIYKNGVGNIIFGPLVSFHGNASPITGDSYALASTSFQQYQKSPLCAAGATVTNLVSPQIFAGTYITAGSGPNVTPPCGGPANVGASYQYTTECASGSPTEVAPTPCPGGRATDGSGNLLPVNWHPMTPIGMNPNDFNTVVTVWNGNNANMPSGIQVVQATQNNVGVTYTPTGPTSQAGSYTPAYWTSVSTTNGKVMLVIAGQPFCVNASTNKVQLPFPLVTGNCTAGFTRYGVPLTGTTTRYLDWGLVTDDLTRPAPLTFFQAPLCTAPCANPGNQNGIRYIPAFPMINVLGLACQQNVDPGLNVFDRVNTGDGINCSSPIRVDNTTTETFSGTYSTPEALVIDNAGPSPTQVSIKGSITSPGSCSSDFTQYNWGIILATGDLSFLGNLVLTGFVYTPGNIFTSGTVVFNGGVFSANIQNNTVDQVDTFGTVNLCAGSAANLPQSPQFFNFTAISWQDRPLNQP